jgi:dihydrofolate synthase/folylpolyglutamate synthase
VTTTRPDAVARLLAFAGAERAMMRPGLERIHGLLADLGHPEAGLVILQVGGTNGKGSVAALAEAILRAAGLRTGLYTSPHLLDATERIRIDGRPVAPAALARVAAVLEPRLERGEVSFFEAMTAAGLTAFRDAGVEAAILEVGLGGRWDATTVGTPRVAAVTRIDYDHQEYLGERLTEIAAEKAAIIRGGVAVSAAQAPEAQAVVEARARAVGVPLALEGRDFSATPVASELSGHRLHLAGPGYAHRDVELALLGLFQPGNAAVAVAAAHAFAAAAGGALPEAAVRAGCRSVRWPGRFQVIDVPAAGRRGRTRVVLDGAHNPAGAAALAASLRHYFPGARLALVLGISADKDRAGILKALAPGAARIVLTAAGHPRAARPADLRAALPPTDGEVVLVDEPAAALTAALEDADVVCVAGSLFLVADSLRWLMGRGLGR